MVRSRQLERARQAAQAQGYHLPCIPRQARVVGGPGAWPLRATRAARLPRRPHRQKRGALIGSTMMSILFDLPVRVRTGSAWPGRGPVI
jgi:hypothetical protein